MEAEKANYPVQRMARLLRVSRSGFYAWRRRSSEESERAVLRAELDAKVRRVHRDSTGIYGAPRVQAALARNGTGVDRKTVAASMRRQGLEGISPRRFRPVAPIGEARVHSIPDLVARKWDTGELDAVWISDITYLRTGEGWVYLCAVRDACSRRVIGWAMDSTQITSLVERALRMAYVLRGGGPAGVVFHADRGTQYTSAQLNDVCSGLGIRQSVGRTGVCWDNAMQESFWSTLKTEFYDRRRWTTRQDAIRETGRWIEEFYNRSRLHSALGYTTPVEHEQFLTSNKLQPAQAA
ncbi:putative transposase [Pseudarthrobacter siccitolerans]|uniref:Transposase n=2 Tax=Pseudarthrobacter siccitolerans TaxID=861266 RepID=A0ABU0PFL1_9MICC|nr:putative transposase [Pseudarthrobacter siccitolerans]MDQ0674758.1 putative transposase [Pseudarthrobacter siccitolerans]